MTEHTQKHRWWGLICWENTASIPSMYLQRLSPKELMPFSGGRSFEWKPDLLLHPCWLLPWVHAHGLEEAGREGAELGTPGSLEEAGREGAELGTAGSLEEAGREGALRQLQILNAAVSHQCASGLLICQQYSSTAVFVQCVYILTDSWGGWLCDTQTHSLTHPLNCFFLAKGRQRILFSFLFLDHVFIYFLLLLKAGKGFLLFLTFKNSCSSLRTQSQSLRSMVTPLSFCVYLWKWKFTEN